MSHTPVTQGQRSISELLTLLVALGLAESTKKAPRSQMLLSHSPVFQGQRAKAPLMLLIALGLAESAQGHSKLLQVVQASTRLPRRCRLAPGSPEGAGWLQAPQKGQAGSNLPRWCRQVSRGVAGARVLHTRCSIGRCFVQVVQVSSPSGAG